MISKNLGVSVNKFVIRAGRIKILEIVMIAKIVHVKNVRVLTKV